MELAKRAALAWRVYARGRDHLFERVDGEASHSQICPYRARDCADAPRVSAPPSCTDTAVAQRAGRRFIVFFRILSPRKESSH